MIEIVKEREGRYERDNVKFPVPRNTVPGMRNALNGENSRLDFAGDSVSETEDKPPKMKQREKRLKTKQNKTSKQKSEQGLTSELRENFK